MQIKVKEKQVTRKRNFRPEPHANHAFLKQRKLEYVHFNSASKIFEI